MKSPTVNASTMTQFLNATKLEEYQEFNEINLDPNSQLFRQFDAHGVWMRNGKNNTIYTPSIRAIKEFTSYLPAPTFTQIELREPTPIEQDGYTVKCKRVSFVWDDHKYTLVFSVNSGNRFGQIYLVRGPEIITPLPWTELI